MTEWGVFMVIGALMGFAVTIVSPLIKLNTSITTLTVTMKATEQALSELAEKNSSTHKRIWEKCRKQDATLLNHENRVAHLEKLS